jgi:hypothetical protein
MTKKKEPTQVSATINLHVETVEEFRELLPSSGLFDMLDCALDIRSNALAEIDDIDMLVKLVESAINVFDVTISADYDTEGFVIKITEVPVSLVEGRKKKKPE